MKITCIADLHGYKPELEGGDLLIVAGDLTARDNLEQHSDFLNWMHKQDYKKKVLIAGNHDNLLKKNPNFYSKTNIDYLFDSGTEYEGLKIWGTPWSLSFEESNPQCRAFTGTEDQLKEKYDQIPNDIDILISHSPFWHMLDQNQDGYACGSRSLKEAVHRIKPQLFVSGHIHEQGGSTILYKHSGPNTICINASYVDERYRPVNKPITIELKN